MQDCVVQRKSSPTAVLTIGDAAGSLLPRLFGYVRNLRGRRRRVRTAIAQWEIHRRGFAEHIPSLAQRGERPFLVHCHCNAVRRQVKSSAVVVL